MNDYEKYELPQDIKKEIDLYTNITEGDEKDLVVYGNNLAATPRNPESTIEDIEADCHLSDMAKAQWLMNKVNRWYNPILAVQKSDLLDCEEAWGEAYVVEVPAGVSSDDPRERVRQQSAIDAAIAERIRAEQQRAADKNTRKALKRVIDYLEEMRDGYLADIRNAFCRRISLIDKGVDQVTRVDRNLELEAISARMRILAVGRENFLAELSAPAADAIVDANPLMQASTGAATPLSTSVNPKTDTIPFLNTKETQSDYIES